MQVKCKICVSNKELPVICVFVPIAISIHDYVSSIKYKEKFSLPQLPVQN